MKIRCTSNNSSTVAIHDHPKISYVAEASKQERDLFCFVGTNIFVQDLITHETIKEPADEYWKRNEQASLTVRQVIAEHVGAKCEDWIKYLNDGGRHLEWIKTTFGLTLTQEDFKRAWQRFNHKSWFDRNGYYIKGWLAVAEALQLGEEARHKLGEGNYPHADRYGGQIRCMRGSDCPICANRKYLESLGEMKPRVTGNERTDKMLAMNFDYWRAQPFWVRNWLLLHNEFTVKHTAKCKKCGELIETGRIFGCDSWVQRIRKEICYDCDGEYQAEVRRLEREFSSGSKQRTIKKHDRFSLGVAQKGLDDFFQKK